MENGAQAGNSNPEYVYHTTSSRFLSSFQGMFHPANADVPFVDGRSLHCSAPDKKGFAGEITAFESAAQAVSSKDSRENNFKIALTKRQEKREELKDEPVEKRRKEDSSKDDDANNGAREREDYWERRRKNNASAKKSREARKARELQTQIKAAFLERENLRILAQLMIVQQENVCLKRVFSAKMCSRASETGNIYIC